MAKCPFSRRCKNSFPHLSFLHFYSLLLLSWLSTPVSEIRSALSMCMRRQLKGWTTAHLLSHPHGFSNPQDNILIYLLKPIQHFDLLITSATLFDLLPLPRISTHTPSGSASQTYLPTVDHMSISLSRHSFDVFSDVSVFPPCPHGAVARCPLATD